MPTNFYFQPFPTGITQEQLLVEDLVIEAMQQYGMDVYYLPRSSADPDGPDTLYGEDTLKQYKVAFPIEVYLENITGMDGEQDFISKFGLEIRDEVTLLISRRRFKYASGATNYNIPRLGDLVLNTGPKRPLEGDLIYIPLLQNFFEVTFVEHENDQAMFYTLGRGRGGNVYVYALKLKQFVFSDELIETGRTEIDEQAFDSYKRTRLDVPINGTGTYEVGEIVYQGNSLETANATAVIHTWNPARYLDVVHVKGQFTVGVTIVGNTSGATWALETAANDMPTDSVFEDVADNNIIQNEAGDILDFTEHNPFGEP
jgi:hypothetical protein